MANETEVLMPAVGNEPQSRTGLGLNCAAQLAAPNYGRECKRMARKGDYCLQHWLMNYGHDFNLLTGLCRCGVAWTEKGAPEICPAKITLVEFRKEF